MKNMALSWTEAPKRGGVMIVTGTLGVVFLLGFGAGWLSRPASSDRQDVVERQRSSTAESPEPHSPIGRGTDRGPGGMGRRGGSTFLPATNPRYADQSVAQLLWDFEDAIQEDPTNLATLDRLLEIAARYEPGELPQFLADAQSAGIMKSFYRNNWALSGLLRFVAGRHARANPEAALSGALAINDPHLRESSLQGVAEEWAFNDPQAAFAWLGEATPEQQASMHRQILREYAKTDAEGAWDFLMNNRHAAYLAPSTAVALIAELEPASMTEIRQYLENLGRDDFLRGDLDHQILDRIAENDPEHLLSMLTQEDLGELERSANRLLTEAVRQIVRRDPEKAQAYLATMPEQVRGRMTSQIAQILQAREGLESAMEFLDTVENESAYNSAILGVADQLAISDPQKALELGRANEDPKMRLIMIDGGYTAWTMQDPAAAWTAAQAETDPPVREAALEAVLASQAEIDPRSAFDKALALGEDAILQDMMMRTFPGLVRRNRQLAKEIAAQLPEDSAHRQRAEQVLAR